jgi:small ubiquitin-related modifier
MKVFCTRQGLDINSTRFRFDGEKVTEDNSPNDLEMEDGDALEVFQEQIGGGI